MKLKSQYIKRYDKLWRRNKPFIYEHVSGGYGRGSFKTTQEQRENNGVYYDRDCQDLKVYPRGCRNSNNLDAWNIEKRSSRMMMLSWKEFHRCSKQYMINT
jgi:hypothetical protein